MPASDDRSDEFSPDDAFAVLANETRLEILRALGEASEALSFTELRKAVGLRQGGQFNYHLDKLVGHFVRKTDGGYELRQPGRGVVQAVLSGTVTADPEVEPSPVDIGCLLCGNPIKVSYRAERVELYCTGCAGQYGERVEERHSSFDTSDGYLGGYQLPPVGVEGRTPEEFLEAASLLTHLDSVALAHGVCPSCGGTVDIELIVCDVHDRTDGRCQACGDRHAVQVERRCSICLYSRGGMAINILATRLELRKFVAEQGIDPLVEGYKWGWDCSEEVHSTDPFLGDFTFEVRGKAITLRADDRLSVIDAWVEQLSTPKG